MKGTIWDHEINTGIKFALDFRITLAYVAPKITQTRRKIYYKNMKLPGRALKLAEESGGLLFNTEEFDAVVEANKKSNQRIGIIKGPILQQQHAAIIITPTAV
ncbi:hypothetical protein AYI70_g751 [Smittium culicis]|uniref:Uncharacterized protein n=1 Tax=Smittium culicis TaxID=133412 RepID=A0A1R1YFH9_9FUNG|nr:hypothetical protein AYI70_g751 [Smittium culicis]